MGNKTRRMNRAISEFFEDKEKDEKRVEAADKFKDLLNKHADDLVTWESWINEELKATDHEVKDLMKACSIKESCAYEYCKKTPSDRNNLIRIGVLLYGCDVSKINQMLTQKAGVNELYAKDKNDFIWLYLFRKYHKAFPDLEDIWKEYKVCWKQMEKYIQESTLSERNERTVGLMAQLGYNSDGAIGQTCTKPFEYYLRIFVPEFQNAHKELMKEIDQWNEKAKRKDSKLNALRRFFYTKGENAGRNPDAAYRQFYRWIKELEKRKQIKRKTLLLYAIHMGLSEEELNHLLEIGHFHPLYARNLIDCAVIYVLRCQKEKSESISHYGDFNTELMDTLLSRLNKLGIQQQEVEKFSSFITGV